MLSSSRHVMLPCYSHERPKNTQKAFAVVRYGGEEATLSVEDGCVWMYLPGPKPARYECWRAAAITFGEDEKRAEDERHAGLDDGIGWSCAGDVLFAGFWLDDQPELSEAVKRRYEALITLCRAKGFGHFYRMWNYLGAINADNAQGEERYRDFCCGRSQAFEAMGVSLTDLPAATGIGLSTGGVAVYALAHRETSGVNIENPRQLPAYRYPRRYGRRSPSFARGTVMAGAQQTVLYVSGTASIIGHETVGQTLAEQQAVMVENIQTLQKTATEHFPELDSVTCQSLKIYVRHGKDGSLIQRAMLKIFGGMAEQSPVFIADICRKELLVEVEAVFIGQ
ncbi:chorismate transformation enzyme, FkbO/Hyg5 family [Saccharibacter floricola]|nr:hypothetical protein [Saccharibacter floricola]